MDAFKNSVQINLKIRNLSNYIAKKSLGQFLIIFNYPPITTLPTMMIAEVTTRPQIPAACQIG